METEITFILPTRNRKAWVVRAIDSCLNCEGNTVKPYVIVIDGESEDGTYDYLMEVYRNNPRVKILKYQYGFMESCFHGLQLVKTKFATFMYDDDVLSLYFRDMIAHMLEHKKNFIMGYGQVRHIGTIYPFKPVTDFKHYPSFRLLLGYFGCLDAIEYTSLPLSPICCVAKTDLLRDWTNHVTEFAKKYGMREYFMLKKNIGPDLMIYLLSILTSKTEICVASATVAQFSEHSTSMTITYENIDLAIGYWLAKIWAFENIAKIYHARESAMCASYLVLSGMSILLRLFIKKQFNWSFSIIREILAICLNVQRHMNCINALIAMFSLLKEYAWKRVHKTSPA
jgi:glycosyltransferase involved in cell wall biosynthesis